MTEGGATVRASGKDGDYTTRHAAYDLRKLRGKGLTAKHGRTRCYHIPPPASRTIAALLALRDRVIPRSWPGSVARR